ncbi:hypothetical protein COY17_03380 [Candidatus Saccharibacteria bacterium CG_4_10_14_0_2_um_filter_52_9]|nr:MAG: hypothetical protein COY17_03380 [Candidatus Saccharibacteria bacterium CG_4_10_14_0_2_um_filter_52_9]
MAETEITGNYLTDCRIWQKIISGMDTRAAKAIAGRQALGALRNRTSHDSRNVILSADAALQIPDGTNPTEETLWPYLQYGEMQTRGWLGRLFCVPMKKDVLLTWALYDARVLGPVEEDYITPDAPGLEEDKPEFRLPIDQPLRRAIHFPVGLINYAVPYAVPGQFRLH